MNWLRRLLARFGLQGQSSGPNSVDALTKELIRIWQEDGLFPKALLSSLYGPLPMKDHNPGPSRLFDANNRNKRAYQIGVILNEMGGIELMRQVHLQIQEALPQGDGYAARKLEQVWHGIGQWQS